MASTWLRAVAAALLLSGLFGAGASARQHRDPVAGIWDAAIVLPAGEVAFGLDLTHDSGRVGGAILNGPERQELSGGHYYGETIVLELDYYDGRITARFEDEARTRLVGAYTRQTRDGIGRFPFHATRRSGAAEKASERVPELLDISGDWILTLYGPKDEVLEVDEAAFEVAPGPGESARISGTIIPVHGDYGLLSGRIAHELPTGPEGHAQRTVRFRMSRFNGIRVVLMTGEVRSDGSLAGELAQGTSAPLRWTAVRKERVSTGDPAPIDPFALTTVRDPDEPFTFAFPDTEGRVVSLSDERYRGKVVLVDIFGTWCPNCHDQTPFLVELARKYGDRGLEVVGLAYEYTPDRERSVRQLDIYRRKHGVTYPLLLAGTTAEGEIARTLPRLVNFGAYPTALFIGRDGRVRRIHAGFSGPATGARYDEVRHEFETVVRELLDEEPPVSSTRGSAAARARSGWASRS